MLQWGEMIDHQRRQGYEPKPFARQELTTQSNTNINLLDLNGRPFT